LKTEILSQERNIIAVKAEYEAGEINKAVGQTIRELSSKVSLKGFRKGHVPRKTLELYFGRNKIYSETAERIVREAMEGIVSEYELDLVATPKLNIGEIEEGQPFSAEFTFEVRPEVTLPDLASVEAIKTIYGTDEVQVDEGLNQLLESNARFEPIDDDRPATLDDIVETQYTTYSVNKDGSTSVIEGEKKNVMILKSVRRDIADNIAGKKPAEEFSFEITLEDDYPDPRLAGTSVRYDMEILQFMKRTVPEATDENVAEISKGRYNTVDELRAELRKQIENTAKERSESSLRESAIKALAASAEIDVPDTMIDRQYDAMRKDQDARLRQDLGLTIDEYMLKNSLNVSEYEGKLRERAAEIVRNTLVLDALSEKEQISFTSEDLNEEIMRMARSARVNPQELADALSKDKDEFSSLAMRVRTRNTMNFLAGKVSVREVPEEELKKEENSAEAEEAAAREEKTPSADSE
jgi:trigger factor